jgi:hypothetical protein
MKMVNLVSAIINMNSKDLEILANNLHFYSPRKAELFHFLLEVAEREGRMSDKDFEQLEKYSDALESVR